jgi:HSP20 family protein
VPDSVDQDKIKASFEKGVLEITLPKRPEAKVEAKKIAISKKE